MSGEEEGVGGGAVGGGSGNANSATAATTAWVEELQKSFKDSKESAIRSARSLQQNSSTHIRSFQDFLPHAFSRYKSYEDAFVNKFKEEVISAKEHPAAAIGIAATAALVLFPGPRRFLIRNTLGRFQSEEARFLKAENNIKELNLSVDMMRKESSKLLERAALAEKEMMHGHKELKNAGGQIQHLAKSVYKVEAQAADLMDVLREIPGRDALKLRAEVASMVSVLRQQRASLDKRIMKISELGIPV
ncbi:hypothetical protein CCACVL1_12620 [Corchorus capsularis]|uniref:Uncharacterized protein n=1 Tax=Corchorus capsularis TaxID=210143 RepID=A0A1R3IER6_COCAP|nr:hypothetical protein CCACVL1_12620 [Corchorus capsularis]